MPSSDLWRRRSGWSEGRLGAVAELVAAAGRPAWSFTLVVLVLTAELFRFADTAAGQPFYADIRAVHTLAGIALSLAVAWRSGTWLWRTFMAPGGGLRAPRDIAALLPQRISLQVALRWGYALSLLVLMVSGLERYAFERHALVPLSLRFPLLWMLLHHTAVPYFYTFALIRLCIGVRIFWRELRGYLYSP